jgi:formyl-CoA transferase
MTLPLEGVLVVSIEQAVAAPQCTCRLADAGARVIKVERPEGDFARDYDHVVHGESANFVWLNRGKESVVLDLGKDADKAVLEAMLAKADVFVQNLKPGALAKLGFAVTRLRKDYPTLICCSISGYGESGPYKSRKAYDLLIQAESGVASVTGGPDAPARVGISLVDATAGFNAYQAILEALLARGRTGQGADIAVSMFDAMAEWMTVPLLHAEGGQPFKRIGLAHATIAPYGVFKSRDGADILIAIQNDREWRVLAEKILGDAALGADPKFATNPKRAKNRAETDAAVGKAFARHDVAGLMTLLEAADIAFARVNDSMLLSRHPHLRRITVGAPTGPVSTPAPTPIFNGAPRNYGAIPALGEHTAAIKAEFSGKAR